MRSPTYISTELNNGVTSVATGNYSSGVEDFIYQVPEGKIAAITRVIIIMTHTSSLDPDLYAGIGELTNGIVPKILKSDDSVLQHLTSDTVAGLVGISAKPIKTNKDWSALCYDFKIIPDSGNDPDLGLYRWTFSRAGLPLVLDNQEKLCFSLNDNFTGLSDHRFIVQGYEAPDQGSYSDLLLRGSVG